MFYVIVGLFIHACGLDLGCIQVSLLMDAEWR